MQKSMLKIAQIRFTSSYTNQRNHLPFQNSFMILKSFLTILVKYILYSEFKISNIFSNDIIYAVFDQKSIEYQIEFSQLM